MEIHEINKSAELPSRDFLFVSADNRPDGFFKFKKIKVFFILFKPSLKTNAKLLDKICFWFVVQKETRRVYYK